MFINPFQISGQYSSTKGVQVKIDGKLYPIEDLLDKSIYAKTKANWYRFPSDIKSVKLATPAGGLVGKVYSWVTRTDDIYAMFELAKGSPYLKDYPSGNFYVRLQDLSDQTLKDQGVKTTKEAVKEEIKKEEEATKTNTDKILETAKQVGLYAVIGFGIAIVLKSIIAKKL
jgi:hypothetical protein